MTIEYHETLPGLTPSAITAVQSARTVNIQIKAIPLSSSALMPAAALKRAQEPAATERMVSELLNVHSCYLGAVFAGVYGTVVNCR